MNAIDIIAKLFTFSCEIIDHRYVLISFSLEKFLSRVHGGQFKQICLFGLK